MANTQNHGYTPLKVRGGGCVEQTRKRVLTNNTTAIFRGDGCIAVATGDLIVNATAATFLSTVSCGASYVSNNERLERNHLPAATLYTATGNTILPDNASYIYCTADNVNTVFEASVDEAIALTDLNLNYLQVLGAGNTTTGMSGHELDATSRATTNTIGVRVIDFIRNGRWDITAADAHVECVINIGSYEPALSANTGI